MFVKSRRMALLGSLIGLIILTVGIILWYNQAIYTASLDTRPFNAGLVGEISTLEPALLDDHEEELLASALYEGLVAYDEDSRGVKPCLAKSWKYSGDGKSLVLNLKRNVRFHNGKALTARDVKAAWEHNFTNTKEWANVSMFMSITGSNERLEGRIQEISGIEVVNDSTIKIKFDQPNAAFIYMLTNPIFWVFDTKDQVKPWPGTGPFFLKENQDNRSLVLLRHDKYHQGQPPLTAMQITVYGDENQAFNDFKAGKLDYLDQVPYQEINTIKKDGHLNQQFIDKPLLESYGVAFNMNKEPFAGNYLLRRALNYAIDRKVIIDTVLGGAYRPAKGVIPSGLPGYSKQMRGYSYDPEKARELLEEAGHPEGEGLAPLVISFNKDEGHRMVVESIARQLVDFGIEVQAQEMDWDYYKKQLGKSVLACARIGWKADYPDADSFLYQLYHGSKIGISNYCSYRNPQVDKVLNASRAETKSIQERAKLLGRAEEIIVDDAPMLWLFQKQAAKLVGLKVNNLEVNMMEMIDWSRVELLKPEVDEGKAQGKKKV